MQQEDPETYAVIGAAMEVHRVLKPGFSEPVYREALEIECADRGIPVQRELRLPIFYKEHLLKTHYRADFVCYETLIVECKALQTIGSAELGQVLNYLRCTQHRRALLINFGSVSLQQKRVVWGEKL